MNRFDRFGQQRGDAQVFKRRRLTNVFDRQRVGHDHFFERRVSDPLDRVTRKNRVNTTGQNPVGAFLGHRLGDLGQCARSVDHVIDDQGVAALDVADDVHDFRLGMAGLRFFATLIDDGEIGVEPFGVSPRPFGAARVRRDDDQVFYRVLHKIIDDQGGREEMIHRDVEKALNLLCVQVHSQDAIGAGRGDQVRDQPGGDRDAGFVLLVAARIAVIWDHGGDAVGRRAPEGVDHYQQLHQVRVYRRASRLHDENVAASDVLQYLKVELAVGKARGVRAAKLDSEILADLFGQWTIGIA